MVLAGPLARGPHRLKGVQGLRHWGAKEAPRATSHPWPLHMGAGHGVPRDLVCPPGIDPAMSGVLSSYRWTNCNRRCTGGCRGVQSSGGMQGGGGAWD